MFLFGDDFSSKIIVFMTRVTALPKFNALRADTTSPDLVAFCYCRLVCNAHVCTSALQCGSQKSLSAVFLYRCPPQCLTEPGACWYRQTGSRALGLAQLPGTGMHTGIHGFSHGCWGSRLSSSCFHSKHFTGWAISPIPGCPGNLWLWEESSRSQQLLFRGRWILLTLYCSVHCDPEECSLVFDSWFLKWINDIHFSDLALEQSRWCLSASICCVLKKGKLFISSCSYCGPRTHASCCWEVGCGELTSINKS